MLREASLWVGISRTPEPMKTAINLSGTSEERPWPESNGHQAVYGRLDSGFVRSLKASPEGVVMSNGAASVAIPFDELWNLAASLEPGLKAASVAPK